MTAPESGLIPLPENFPVEWKTPQDAERHWTRDLVHFPAVLPVLGWDFMARVNIGGMNRAHEHYGRPFRALRGYFNGYAYGAMEPVLPGSDVADAGRRAEQNVTGALPGIWERWETEWLPEVQRHIEWWDAFDLPGAHHESLADHLSESLERATRCWHIHFLLAPLITNAGSIFSDLYMELFGEDRELEAHMLTLAEEQKSLEADEELWKLGRLLVESANAGSLSESGSDEDLKAALGPALDEYLSEYGHRAVDGGTISSKCWTEDPGPALAAIRVYSGLNGDGPEEEHRERIAERDRLIDETRVSLGGYPQAVRDQFEGSLLMAQQGSRLQEDHNFWIDQQVNARTRYVIAEVGRRLAAEGVIPQPDDVNHLYLSELPEALAALVTGDTTDLNDLVTGRAADLEYWSTIEGPGEIGTRPVGRRPDTPGARGLARFFGMHIEQDDDPTTVNGNPAAPGVSEGVARLVTSLNDAGKVSAGDVLVAPTTWPAWTPLFQIASAVVTDAGGVLSHCAIVAREYGIPAVVGTGVATSRIEDGQRIRVDGNAGVVQILD